MKKSKNKILIIVAIILFFGLGFFAGTYSGVKQINIWNKFWRLNIEQSKIDLLQYIDVGVKITDSNSKVIFSDILSIPEWNALQLLESLGLQVSKSGEGSNAFITAIGGVEAKSDNREFWAFYINGKQATVGAGSYQLKNNDKIEWKIEKY